MDYVIITPVRNEQDRFSKTVKSVVSQTVSPKCWVIVDDGSTDDTAAVADFASQTYPWIRVVHRPDRGARKQGGGVIEAFYDGFNLVERLAWDFICKLDGDLTFAPDYFERCLARFTADDRLGIGGGRIDCLVGGVPVEDSPNDPAFHVRGAVKIYRRELWLASGGIFRTTGWDTLDEVKANMLGWRTYTFKDLRVLQLKATGSADGIWSNWMKNGRANYITGYHPAFMMAKCLKRCLQPPYFLTSLGLAWGYVRSLFLRDARVNDPALIRYVRQQQIQKLTMRPSLWD